MDIWLAVLAFFLWVTGGYAWCVATEAREQKALNWARSISILLFWPALVIAVAGREVLAGLEKVMRRR